VSPHALGGRRSSRRGGTAAPTHRASVALAAANSRIPLREHASRVALPQPRVQLEVRVEPVRLGTDERLPEQTTVSPAEIKPSCSAPSIVGDHDQRAVALRAANERERGARAAARVSREPSGPSSTRSGCGTRASATVQPRSTVRSGAGGRVAYSRSPRGSTPCGDDLLPRPHRSMSRRRSRVKSRRSRLSKVLHLS